jgi:hypothetical protein
MKLHDVIKAMVNGLKFPSRLLASNHQGHWNEGRAALWMAV